MLKLCNVVIALLGLVLTVEGRAGVRDSRCDDLPNGTGAVMADGQMCKQFLLCWNYFIKGPVPCAGGTIFNSTSGRCDARECIESRTGLVDGCSFVGALPEDCSKFIICDHGMQVQLKCGEGTYYSNDLLLCVEPIREPEIPQKQNCAFIN